MSDLLIISGMSGAGKSQVVDALEDLGYFCADNVPPALISTFAALPRQSQGKISHIALVVDVRSRDTFSDMLECLRQLEEQGSSYQLLFLDCADGVLETRYKETRRRHPLLGDSIQTTADAVLEERRILENVRQQADFIIDTTLLSANQLKAKVRDTFSDTSSISMNVSVMSFGFKYGLPRDSDLVFDVRCLPNPHYLPELKPQTGLDKPVSDYVMDGESARVLLDKLKDLLNFLIPLYIQEGKSQLVVAIGCTGGRHRSVTFVEQLVPYIQKMGLAVGVLHRDIKRANVQS